MQSRGSQPDRNSRQSDDLQQIPRDDSFVNRLRDRGPEVESFRYADVSVYIDQDGSRYRIERLPAEQPAPLPSSAGLASSPQRRYTSDKDRHVEGLDGNSLPVPQSLLLRSLNDQQSLQSEAVRRRSADSREDRDISSRQFKEVLAPPSRNVRYGQRGDQDDVYSLDRSVNSSENPRHPPWQDLESEGPSLELSPVHREALSSFPRDHRLAHNVASASSPVSIISNSQSHVNIPHYVSNGFDLRTPIVLTKSTPSTTSGDSMPIETETPGERMLLEAYGYFVHTQSKDRLILV